MASAEERFALQGDVHLLELPLDVYARAMQRQEDVLRELALIAISEASDGGTTAPSRLAALIDQLSARFSTFAEVTRPRITSALVDGHPDRIDVTLTAAISKGEDAQRLRDLLDEVDEYCRRGDLLTLARTPGLTTFVHWYLDEFIGQLRGAEPVPWPRYAAEHAADEEVPTQASAGRDAASEKEPAP